MRRVCIGLFAIAVLMLGARSAQAAPAEGKKPTRFDVTYADHKTETLDVQNDEHKKKLNEKIAAGEVEKIVVHEEVDVMALSWDLGLWAIVVFVLLFLVLKSKAWGPILEGLRKREETIRSAVEEAKLARNETQRLQAQYKAEMDAKFAEIPKIMEEARRDAEALKEELRSQANKEIGADRQRLRREIDSARDQALKEIWEQAAQLATLISAKVIGKSLSQEEHHRLIDESLQELRTTVQERGR